MGKRRLSRFQGFLVVSAALISAMVILSGLVVGRFFERHVLTQEEEQTAKVVQVQARQHLAPADFEMGSARVERRIFEGFLRELPGVFRIKVFDGSGRIVWSNEPRLIGMAFPENSYLARALTGELATVLEAPERSEHLYERTKGYLAEAYVPISFPGSPQVVGVIETYKDVTGVVLGIRRTQRLIWGVTFGAGLFLYLALAFVVWRASVKELQAISRLEAQNRELTLIQQLTQSVLQPLELGPAVASLVVNAGVALDLSQATLYRVRARDEIILLARWPAEAPATPLPPQELIVEAIETRKRIIRGTTVAHPIFSAKETAYVFLAEFKDAVADPDVPAARALEIMLQQAAMALANAELFTEIREAHERLAAILAGIADRMLIVDRQMRIVWMNAGAAEALGGGDGGLGLPCFQVLGAEPEACHGCPAVRTFLSGKVERGVRAQRLPGGEVRYLDLVTAPLRDASGQVHQVLEMARDITELVEMEQRLKQSAARLEASHAALLTKTEELERTNEALQAAQAQLVEKERLAAVGQVVVGLHHEILNPLTGILGALQLLKQKGIAQPRRSEALAEAEAEIRKIERLIRRLAALRRTTGSPYVGETTMLDLEHSCGEEEA